jgi:valyl-tRNA synthetase
MENIRPWTLSRQLWWGHRIPIYYCADGHSTAAKSRPEACKQCGEPIVRQEEDVLDTWFSSALWPFATLGWPEQTADLARYYPTSFMNTSSQILYLWIARMIMTGLKFMGDVPFPTVLINPTILNKQGQRMSKSLGTGIDPLDLVEEFGADALRFGLMTSGSTHQQDIRFNPDRVEQARNFANKLWNVARAVLTNQQTGDTGTLQLEDADRWILSRLTDVTRSVTNDLERYEFAGAGLQLFDFIWSEFADWYLEMAKLRLYDEAADDARYTARSVSWAVLATVVRLLHPIMPFLTEEIWQHLRPFGSQDARELAGLDGELSEYVMTAVWPSIDLYDAGAVDRVDHIMQIVRSVRTTRSEYRVDPAKFISATIATNGELFGSRADIITRLARLRPLNVVEQMDEKPERSVALIVGESTVYLPLAEMTDLAAEGARLARELAGATSALDGLRRKLANDSFTSRAPAEVVERERARLTELEERVARIEEQQALLLGAG